MQTRTCTNCGADMDDCDAWECHDCHDCYCHECLPEPGPVCPVCQEKDDIFNEVVEALNGLARALKQEEKREAAMMNLDEARGK